MSTSNKRVFDDELLRQNFIHSSLSIKKRLCISLVPSVPRGGANYFNLNHPILSDNSKETTLDAGDRTMDKS